MASPIPNSTVGYCEPNHDEKRYINNPEIINNNPLRMVFLYPKAFTHLLPNVPFNKYPKKKKKEIRVVNVFFKLPA
jgi:hypothetical protein